MKMRKIIAVLAAAMMLCAVIPMGAISVSAAPLLSWDFEDGATGWSSKCTLAVEEADGNKYLSFDSSAYDWANMYKSSSKIVANTDYLLTFKAKASSATNLNFKVNNNWAGDTAKVTVNVGTEWQEYSEVFNSGNLTATALLLFSTNTTAANGRTYYLDDITISEYVAPGGNIVKNGDFETGSLSGWSKAQSTAISADAAYEGSYGAHLQGNGGWGGMLNQTFNVEAGKNYELSFWIKANTSGVNIQIKDANGSGATLTNGGWFKDTSWTQKVYTITAASDAIYLNFCGGGNGNAESVYLDNVSLVELKDPSFDGYITNGDFETGKVSPWTVYSGTAVSADAAKDGDYGLYIKNPTGGWGGTAYQNFTTEVGKTYVVMMDAKALSNGQNIQIKDNGTSKATKWFTDTSWTTLSFEYTAESTAGTINICGGGTGGNEEIYVDNIFVFEKKAASNDGYIVNGDFETGTMEGLSPSQQTCVSRDAAKDGNFGLKMLGNGGWGGVGLWTITGLEAGATYKFEMDMNAIEQGFNWTLWQDSTSSGVKYAYGYFSTKAWTHIEKEFVANSDKAVLNINGGGNGNAETVYLDNVKLELVTCASCTYDSCTDTECNVCGTTREAGVCVYDNDFDADCNVCGATRTVVDPVTFGGNSVSEDVKGLAFAFTASVNGIEVVNGNVADYTNATLGEYKLLGMGAKAANAISEIDIPCVYLMDLEADSAAFAVRIINIPDANLGDDITVTPYYIVEIDGVATTIYGDAQVGAYNTFA